CLILSMHTDPGYVREAMQAGTVGYVLKDAGVEELELAIRAALRGALPRPARLEASHRRLRARAADARGTHAHASAARDPPADRRGPLDASDRRAAARLGQDRRDAPRPAHGPTRHPRCGGAHPLRD